MLRNRFKSIVFLFFLLFISLTMLADIVSAFDLSNFLFQYPVGENLNLNQSYEPAREGILQYGTYRSIEYGSNGQITFPGGIHTGIDLLERTRGLYCPSNATIETLTYTPLSIYVSNYGIVSYTGEASNYNSSLGFGNVVVIKHLIDNGSLLYSLYAHMLNGSVVVSQNDYVVKGQDIGFMGNTGASDAPHIHFEFKNEDALGPAYGYIDSRETTNWMNEHPDSWGYHNPYSFIGTRRVLLPEFSLTGGSWGTYGTLYGYAKQRLYASFVINNDREEEAVFSKIGVRGHGPGGTTDVKDIFFHIQDQTICDNNPLICIDNNTTVGTGDNSSRRFEGNREFNTPGDYEFYVYIGDVGQGYPITFSILENEKSKIVDDDSLVGFEVFDSAGESLSSEERRAIPKTRGYGYGAYLTNFEDVYTAKWSPSITGKYKIEVYIPKRSNAVVIYGIYPDGLNRVDAKIDHSEYPDGGWAKLIDTNDNDDWDFSENGFVDVSGGGGTEGDKVGFDAVKFKYSVDIHVDDNYPSPIHSACSERTGIYDDPYCKIQDGINAAQEDDTVLVADGTYYENISFDGSKNITVLTDEGAIINGDTDQDGIGNGSVVTFNGGDSSTLDGFTITNGSGTDIYGNNYTYGGGILCDSSSPSIINCNITGNSLGQNGDGGGIFCKDSSPSITNCTISENSVVWGGGGISCKTSSPTISGCTLSNNSAGWAGGIYCELSSSPTITNCTITKNSANHDGGGIFCYTSSSPTITNCTITDNSAYLGGGIRCHTSSATITNCIISSNTGGYYGGGVCCKDSNLNLSNCVVNGNVASYGGGIFCDGSASQFTNSMISNNMASARGGGIACRATKAKFVNCVINNNIADDYGAGVYCEGWASPKLTNCTISSNSAGKQGGGVYCESYSLLTVKNCILWGDIAGGITNEITLFYTSGISITYSNIQGGWTGIGNKNINPQFIDPNNGNYHLRPESPCIDKGTDDITIDPNLPTDDIDGDHRPQGAGYDMGADEVVYETATTPTGNTTISLLGSTITYENVITSGETTITVLPAEDPPLSSDFQLLGNYFEITTTATYSDTINICFTYDDSDLTEEQKQNLQLLHYENSDWINITSSLDAANKNICGQTNSLSPFAIAFSTIINNDTDGDGITDDIDNCPTTVNPEQADCDGDGIGNECDSEPDINPPALVIPGDIIAECSGSEATSVDIGTATAIDDCCGSIDVTNDAPNLFQIGTTDINWIATDCNGLSTASIQKITVQDTTPPDLSIPSDIIIECNSPNGTLVNIGTPTTSDICCENPIIANNAPASFSIGTTEVTWISTDCNGNSVTGKQKVTVQDTTPPYFSLSVSPDTLWPPNHKMVQVIPSFSATDTCDGSITITLVSIIMNEGDETNTFDPTFDYTEGDGYTLDDIQVTDEGIFLRAERSGQNNGRIYTIKYKAIDDSGNESVKSATVTVPHNQ